MDNGANDGHDRSAADGNADPMARDQWRLPRFV